MGPHCIYRARRLPPTTAVLHLQEARLALLPLRPLLLRDHPQFHLFLDFPFESCSLRRLLQPLTWILG